MIQDYIKTKTNGTEMDYYKQIFIEHFGEKRINIIPHYWQPKWDKDGNEISGYVDPSARTLSVY
jgi:hypothetical protein